MHEAQIELLINGQPVSAPAGTTVLSALQNAALLTTRISLSGEERGGLCGMGICFECQVLVSGQCMRACQTLVQPGQQVQVPQMTVLEGES